MVEEEAIPDIESKIIEIKSEILELKSGLMEIATQVGRLKGELKTHKEKPDAHHPAMLPKDVN